MENPSKKQKVDDGMTTNPFFKLHTDVHPLMIQHFTGKEVLVLFRVSSKSYQVIRELPAALDKIQLRFRDLKSISSQVPFRKKVTALLESVRKYQNVKAEFKFLTNAGRKLLLLERFSQSLVSLTVTIEKEGFFSKLPVSLSFPKLKSLDIKASAQIILKLLEAAGNLERLSIRPDDMDAEVAACVMNQEKLKEMMLCGDREDFFAVHKMKDVKFKLEALTIKDAFRNSSSYIDVSDQARSNFEAFVLQSADTLKSLKLENYFAKDINLALKLTVLEHLQVQRYHGSTNNLQLQPNDKIKTLECYETSNIPELTRFLACLPNLENLATYAINGLQFEWIIRNMPNFNELRIVIWHHHMQRAVEEANAHYNQLKQSDSSIKQDIKIVGKTSKSCNF
jgi:hypothetical protein